MRSNLISVYNKLNYSTFDYLNIKILHFQHHGHSWNSLDPVYTRAKVLGFEKTSGFLVFQVHGVCTAQTRTAIVNTWSTTASPPILFCDFLTDFNCWNWWQYIRKPHERAHSL